MPYSNPVPRGRLGRTDQGVDVSAPPGTPVRAIATERLIGIIPNWFQGQPFYYFKELGSGAINYVAEQFRSGLKIGQIVQQGQVIGRVAPTGTGLELGFAQDELAAGSGHPTPGYIEGQQTALGQRYRRQVFGGHNGYVAPRSIVVAASVFGGPRDPATGSTGYHGDNLKKNPDSFAELSKNPSALDFSALGNLPYMAPVTVTDLATGKSVTLYKRDVGAGGAGLQGHPRAIDIWYQAAQQIGLRGTGLVRVTFAGNSTPGSYGGTRPGGNATGSGQSAVPDVIKNWQDQTQSGSHAPDPGGFWQDLLGAVTGPLDFFKLLAWIINPVNILRAVELLIGLVLMGFGFQAMLQAYGEGKEGFVTSENPLSRSGLGRVSREVAYAARTAATEGRSTGKSPRKPSGSTSNPTQGRRIRPAAAPHRTRRQALRLRYEREKVVSERRANARRQGA